MRARLVRKGLQVQLDLRGLKELQAKEELREQDLMVL
ncbi:hypothetical protein PAEN110709_30895 [Paenibacillus endophyticus]